MRLKTPKLSNIYVIHFNMRLEPTKVWFNMNTTVLMHVCYTKSSGRLLLYNRKNTKFAVENVFYV